MIILGPGLHHSRRKCWASKPIYIPTLLRYPKTSVPRGANTGSRACDTHADNDGIRSFCSGGQINTGRLMKVYIYSAMYNISHLCHSFGPKTYEYLRMIPPTGSTRAYFQLLGNAILLYSQVVCVRTHGWVQL